MAFLVWGFILKLPKSARFVCYLHFKGFGVSTSTGQYLFVILFLLISIRYTDTVVLKETFDLFAHASGEMTTYSIRKLLDLLHVVFI